ncbi:DUF357 domain-containing protein [Candidatus Pacearchaeota archaeon]|nr:DUF357 domain-containing protein [Candidatus Pacearchaeota archaeon]
MVADKISMQKLMKYLNLTNKALEIIKNKIIKSRESEAKKIIEMAANYLSDAAHFEKKGDFVNAFAAVNYAHGWIDAGVRLGIFDVNDNKIFTVK